MTWSHYLFERLIKAIHNPSGPTGVEAFHFCLNEKEQFSTHYEKSNIGTLTLIWQDGSVSLHQIRPSYTLGEELPIKLWRTVRFFDQEKRYFVKAETAFYPEVSLYDPSVAEAIDTLTNPVSSQAFQVQLTLHKQTVAHSKGLFQDALLTEVHLSSRNGFTPFTYRSRKLPTTQEMLYLQTETEWIEQQPALPLRSADWNNDETVLLFAPEAFRSLIHRISASTDEWSKQSRFAIRYDPLVPWSIGSYRFTASGAPAVSNSLHKALSTSSVHHSSGIHWEHSPPTRFREWLPHQESVLYIPELYSSEGFNWQEHSWCWIPNAIWFHRGRPVSKGGIRIPFSPTTLLSSMAIELISKVGWDVCGVALPLHNLRKDLE